MRFYRVVSVSALSTLALTCLAGLTFAASVRPIGMDGFSGSETLLTFSAPTSYFDTHTVNGVVFNDEAEGFLFLKKAAA